VINEFAEEVKNEVAVSLDELENLQAVSVEECSSILIKLQRAWMVLGKAHCTCCRIALSKSGMKPPSAGIYYYYYFSYRMLPGTLNRYGGWSGQFRSSDKETIRWVSRGAVKQDWSFRGKIMQSWYLPNDSPKTPKQLPFKSATETRIELMVTMSAQMFAPRTILSR